MTTRHSFERWREEFRELRWREDVFFIQGRRSGKDATIHELLTGEPLLPVQPSQPLPDVVHEPYDERESQP